MALFNVTSYGAVGDAVYTTGSMTTGSNIVTAPTGTFKVGDVGKLIWFSSNPTIHALGSTGQSTITGFTDSAHVTVGVNSATTGSGFLVFATQDDTAAFVSAFAAARAAVNRGTVYAPTGGYWVSSRFYDANGGPTPDLIGDGPAATSIYPSPGTTVPGDGSGILLRMIGGFATCLRDFGIAGPQFFWAMNSLQAVMDIEQAQRLRISNVVVNGFGSTTDGASFLKCLGDQSLTFDNLHFQISAGSVVQQGSNHMDGILFDDSNGNLNNCISSDWYRCYVVQKNPSRVGGENGGGLFGGPQLNIIGGTTDDPISGVGLAVLNHGNATLIGTNIWGSDQAGIPALSIDGTSEVWAVNSDIGMYTPAQRQAYAMTLAAGGKFTSAGGNSYRGDRLDDVNIINDGTFIASASDVFKSAKTGVNLPINWRSSFSRPNAVLR